MLSQSLLGSQLSKLVLYFTDVLQGASMRHCSCFFLVLVLAAASAGSLVASQNGVRDEKHVLQTQASSTGLALKQLPDEKSEGPQLPVRRAGAAPHRRGARLRLRRKRRADREARISKRDPDNASEGVGRASDEPSLKRNDAGNEEDEANLQEAVELAMRSKPVPQQSDAASTIADEKDANHEVHSNAGSKGVSLEDGKSGALAQSGATLSNTASKDSKTGIGGERADLTSGTSITAVQGQKAADSSPLKDAAELDPQPMDPKASATLSSAKGAAQQEAKPSLVDQKRTGDLGIRQKISEPLPHDGGSQEGSEDLGDPDKEHSYPALETPGDDPYDSSQSAFTLGKNGAADSEEGEGVQPTSKDPGDSAAGGKKPEQSREGAQSSKEASNRREIPPGDKLAAGKSPAAAGRGNTGAKDAARLGKVPGGGSEATGAKSGLGAKSGSSESSRGIGADVAKSDKEPSGNVQGLRDAIALLQRGDVGDGVFELASEVCCFMVWPS